MGKTEKKNIEKDCIDKALKYSKSQHGKSKRIINMLNGIVKDSERPDFIAETTDINGEQIILGIEHFQIDGVCIKKKNGKYAGTEQKRLKDTKTVFDKYKNQVGDNNYLSEETFNCATNEILKIVNKAVEYSFNATYNDFVKMFEEKLTSHAKSIDVYYDTINKHCDGLKNSKLMFLIDVVGNFNGLFLNSNNKVNQITIDEIPLFSDIVNLLNTIVGNKIDYIVLCLGNGDKTKVIALDAKNILGELKKQNIKVYEYFCYDYLLPFMLQSRCSYQEFKKPQGAKDSIKDDIVFEMELVKQVEVNIDYILMLVAKYHQSNCKDKEILASIDKAISASLQLRSKKELIDGFISTINVETNVTDDWGKFVQEQKKQDIDAIITEQRLKPEETIKFIDNSFRDGVLKTTGTDIDKIMPPVSRFGSAGKNRSELKQKIIDILQRFFEKYRGLV